MFPVKVLPYKRKLRQMMVSVRSTMKLQKIWQSTLTFSVEYEDNTSGKNMITIKDTNTKIYCPDFSSLDLNVIGTVVGE